MAVPITTHATRRVKIVATLGPATGSAESIRALVQAGADVVRLNFSHGTHEEHTSLVNSTRTIAAELGRPIAVLQDLQGPRVRTVDIADSGPTHLLPDHEVIVADASVAEKEMIAVGYAGIHLKVAPGSRILLDDGRLELQVAGVSGVLVRCRVVKGGLLGSNKGVNLPGVNLGLPSFTEKDRADLKLGLELGIDMVALSFVQHAADAKLVREMLRAHRISVPVVAKIENQVALRNIDGILRSFDGIMVARGDLGVELSPEEVPIWQKTLIQRARKLAKATIVATQMLESMIQNPRPTRAEASDVANAVIDGTDAVMLSGETAVGSYPAEAVAVMGRIIERTEAAYPQSSPQGIGRSSNASAVAHAASSLATDLGTRAVVVLTRTGRTARLVSNARPPAPIIAITKTAALARQLALWWGVTPVVMEFPGTTEAALDAMEKTLLRQRLVNRGDTLIVVGAVPFSARARANFLKVHTVASRPLTEDGD